VEHGGVDPIPVPLELLFEVFVKRSERRRTTHPRANDRLAKLATFRFSIQAAYQTPEFVDPKQKFLPPKRQCLRVSTDFGSGLEGV
jgi:hypothetical protein